MRKPIIELIEDTWKKKGRLWPSLWEGMGWVNTELGEAYELLLTKDEYRWVRNTPEKHGKWDQFKFEEELGDAILMLMVTGMAIGLNPMEGLREKLEKELEIRNE